MSEKSLLMPYGTAVWLIYNTKLTFNQIAKFCNMHILQIQAIADGELAKDIKPIDPMLNNQLEKEEIRKCELDSKRNLSFLDIDVKLKNKDKKKSKYIPIVRRKTKPNGILWLIKNYPELEDKDIAKLVSTLKSTVKAIRNEEYRDIKNLVPKDPVLLCLCTQTELNNLLKEVRKKGKKDV